MSKGYNPNPNSRKIYSSIKTQIRLLINKYKSDKNAIHVFETTKIRFEILRQVAFDLAVRNPNLHFQVFDDRCCCIVTQHIPLKEAFSYTWVKQSEVSGKWLVMAVPPGATRIDSLTVWIKEEDARKVALRILNKIRNFPLL
ncbi:hypothetical protein [Calothrix sp. UHCC 0171]|uniref:hypothetical protein n=1 Tax=Calothrix sp. UHCC 0171 TaxID=3110245 RepID=UPI002B1F3F7A|nr:hypothetical protein [Calothrix sp. UHCC 0171]MEA5574434.1 hypothetical protein [Calothrix sp. UHCC 0171]